MKNVVDQATNAVAIGGLSLPLWFHSLEQISQVAALCVPVLGAVWLVIQIVAFIVFRKRGDD